MKYISYLISSVILVGSLTGCGAESETEAETETDFGIQWTKLTSMNATKLSEYQLFEDATNPTINPNGNGLPYDLSTPLFTDYASKYRFVFIPPGKSATYVADEALNFPVGTTLVKTFALPSNTDNRGIENEDLIETRLLIKRESGWKALPYVWNSDKTDAFLDYNGASIPSSITHEGVTSNFDYKVPDPQSCINCHGIKLNGADEYTMTPIGPKIRFLNKDFDYTDGAENQITKWVAEGFLTGAPSDISNLDQAPIVSDATSIGDLSNNELELAAKAWLDINCAHCHRRDPHGLASNTNMQVEWGHSYSTHATEHGACQLPISFGGDGGNDSSYVIEPGSSEKSLLVFRMNTNDGGDAMPPLGRSTIHKEGVELISAWIDSLPANSDCN